MHRQDRVMTFVTTARAIGATLFAGLLLAAPVRGADLNDYPTVARADYVFACMKAGGETRHRLEQCSCSIDVIASILPYDHYVTAETLLSLAQIPGERGGTFRATEQSKAALNDLRRAQAEAEVRCSEFYPRLWAPRETQPNSRRNCGRYPTTGTPAAYFLTCRRH